MPPRPKKAAAEPDARDGFTYLENPNSPESAGWYPDGVAEVLLAQSIDQAWKAPKRVPADTPDPSIDGVPAALPEGN